MSDGDIEHKLQMNSSGDSSVNPEHEITAPLQSLDGDTDETVLNSSLDQQVDAAFRDVEDMFEANITSSRPGVEATISRAPEFDWSIPNLVEPEQSPELSLPEEAVSESASSFELPPPDSVEEAEIREFLRTVERRITDIGEERQQAENRLLIKLETEAALQAEAAARRREEEELRRQAYEAAAARREEDDQKLKVQRDQVSRSESELKAIWAEERRLRSEAVRLNQAVQELLQKRARAEDDAKLALLVEAQRARDEAEEIHLESLARLHSEEEALRRAVTRYGLQRTELEAERQRHDAETRKFEEERAALMAASAARLAETNRLRAEAEERLRSEQQQLVTQENELTRLAEELAQQRAALEVARQNAEEDAKRIAEARARMDASVEAAQLAERERLIIEAQIIERAEAERQLLEDSRARALEQQRQLELNARELKEKESLRLAELESLRISTESSAHLYLEKEQILRSELESLQQTEQATLVRLEEFESQRQVAAETHARMLEKLRRVEEEAHARSTEESQARLDLERRIKEETENLRRLELEHKQRIDEEISRRLEAEKRLQEIKTRYQVEQAARIKAELQFDLWNEPGTVNGAEATTTTESQVVDVAETQPLVGDQEEKDTVAVYQVGNLSSADPRLRADAVISLARLGSDDAYDLIVNCFDDESTLVRNAAARAMLILEPHRPVEPFTRALKEASTERSARIGKAISDSGLAAQAINTLSSEDREETYNGLCLLFTMAKTGEVEALVKAIETHADAEVRLASIRLLKLSGQEELATAAVERRLRTNKES